VHCQPSPPAEPTPSSDRRKESRIPVNEKARLISLPPLEVASNSVQVMNKSKSGLRLKTSAEFPVGVLVQVRLTGTVVLGEVRYCTADQAGGFFVGIQIRDSFPIPS
jgi:hypothetical protein